MAVLTDAGTKGRIRVSVELPPDYTIRIPEELARNLPASIYSGKEEKSVCLRVRLVHACILCTLMAVRPPSRRLPDPAHVHVEINIGGTWVHQLVLRLK